MSEAKPIRYAEAALAQLDEIADYIAGEGQPGAARTMLHRSATLVDSLGRFPLSGHRYETSDPRLQQIRIIAVPGYNVLIYHEVTEDHVFIHAVLSGSRGTDFVEQSLRS